MGIRNDKNWEQTDLRGRIKEGLYAQANSHSCKSTFGGSSNHEYKPEPACRDVRQGRDIRELVQKPIGGVADQLTDTFLRQLASNNEQIKALLESNREIENAIALMQELRKSLSDESEH